MKAGIGKYFWSMNEEALREVAAILQDPGHPRFKERVIALLSRCDEPRELFGIVPEETFMQQWPEVRRAWRKRGQSLDYLSWWDAIYQNILSGSKASLRMAGSQAGSEYLRSIGEQIKSARLAKGWTQSELARRIGLQQRKISAIENGKSNVTMVTFLKLAKALGIEKMDLNLGPESRTFE